MKNIEDLKKHLNEPYSPIVAPYWMLILMLVVFSIAYVSNDLKVMVISVFCISGFGLATINQRQKKITKLLLEEIEKNNQQGETK